ncbi:MAG: EAL domain-containing protein [Coriobacteriales bacterium]|nr:EAL domain-containing protein [Coriobacteriales bacterium]
MRAAKVALSLQVEHLDTTATDWSVWDDSVDFVRTRSRGFVETNLNDESFHNAGVTAMVFTDARGDVVFAKAVSPEGDVAVDVPQELLALAGDHAAQLVANEDGGASSGLLETADGVLLVAERQILPSDGAGPSAGALLMAKHVGVAELSAMQRVTNNAVVLFPVHSAELPGDVAAARRELRVSPGQIVVNQEGTETISAYSLLEGIHGAPAAIIRVSRAPRSLQAARTYIRWTYAGLIAFGLLTVVAIGVVLDRPLLGRLTRLQEEVESASATGDSGARVTVDGEDEIRDLAVGVNDMLEAIQRSEREQAELGFLAAHDPLTQLLNRRRFEEEFERELDEAKRLGDSGTVVWMDIDHFKNINDALGHGAGDDLLVAFGDLLKRESRSYNTLSRLGGDEFALLLPHSTESAALEFARRFALRLAVEEFEAAGHSVKIACSFGIVEYPRDGDSVEELMKHADIALYRAKECGRGRVEPYSCVEADAVGPTCTVDWAARISDAMHHGRLVLHAMPTRRVADGDTGPYELLLRMTDDQGNVVPVNAIVAGAERTGIIRDLDRWVIHRAVEMLAHEREIGHDTSFSINISSSALSDNDLPIILKDAIEQANVDPSRLIIEIGETAALGDIPRAQRFITAVKEVGCGFSLDGFGSGASNFLYLRKLPIDFLKIDGVLVRSLCTARADRYFIRAIVDMCKALDIKTVAEFVEDESLLAAIKTAGVDYAQGFEIGEAEPLERYVDGPEQEFRDPEAT